MTLSRDHIRLIRALRRIAWMLHTAANRLRADVWGVRLGTGCRFAGRTLFWREPGSRIEVGAACEFRSARWSNRLGINRPCMISTLSATARIRIGARAGLSGTVIGAAELIEIGDNVLCGANVTITDTDWHGLSPASRGSSGESAPVRVGNNVFLGLNTIVLKGVTIGDNSVIGAGSVVTRSIPPNVIAAGNPARVIRPISDGTGFDD